MNPFSFDLEFGYGYEVLTDAETQTPTSIKWVFQPLYKVGKRGETRTWQIGYDSTTNQIITKSGVLIKNDGSYGNPKTGRKTVTLNRSGRNLNQQALLQARSRYKRQYKKEMYRPAGEEAPTRFKEMLANEYQPPNIRDPQSGEVIPSNINQEHLTRGVSCQSKVDGIRALSWINDEKNYINLYSRGNNLFDSPVHIRTELWYFFFYLKNLIKEELFPHIENIDEIPEIGIDGELYNHDIPFEEISSIVRTELQTHARINEMQYWMYDIMIKNVPTEYRLSILEKAYNSFKETNYYQGNILVLSNTTVHTYEDIDTLYSHYLNLNFEGLMMRKVAGSSIYTLDSKQLKETYYVSGRSDNLLKYKPSKTEEVTVLDIVSGEGKEEGIGNLFVQDIRGNQFYVHPKGSFDKRREWLINKQNYIGKPYTIRYNELTLKGVPRFPVGLAFRTYE